MKRLILASSSPRRKELLEMLHLTFEVSSSDVDESYDPLLSPEQIVMDIASRKAKAVANKCEAALVIGADTIVVLEHKVLGKPKNSEEAYDMLKLLSGKTHSVYTGVAIVDSDREIKFYEKTDVTFWELTDEEITTYIQSGEPLDKAGAYGIQQLGAILVKQIKGDYYSVVGLPLSKTVRELKKLGFNS
ncbi:septum formation inhibitor Maf [Bacillus aquiflavi]|uniref:dTTP/UTP pyrophosphatase n=1 Tax=Bacillus aquiflavi TaxID=2672567 RepID=A0A6B3VWY4_9BACI|nr:Maf family protein [Bacillus aquiflavi]MBA4537204.1 septum formation inhibitor Maf [Bacillus aquiflavi]NEY81462.1 septum formation inhibitor Maf [Bacillus aquiflavi]UAC47422.1 Maf family protein [Bacillus aquiflavi]